MSIPLIQEATKDAINTSIIAIKRNIERINMLLGLVDNDSPDLSGLATKQELQDAITELTPVDEVTSGNMQSVTSNAVNKSAVLKSDYDNLVLLGFGNTTGQFVLSDDLSKFSLVLIGVTYEAQSITRMNTQLVPTKIIKNRNSSSSRFCASIFNSPTAYIGVMFHYVDERHINIDQFAYSSSWVSGVLTIWGIK